MLFSNEGKLADVDTRQTTAHLTCVTDLRLSKLVSYFGKNHAQAAWHAGSAAIDLIERIRIDEKLDCDFARVPGYLHLPIAESSRTREAKQLLREADLAAELGFAATYLERVPGILRPGIRFPNQAKFHPLKYLTGLLESLPSARCQIFAQSEVTAIEDDPLRVEVKGHNVRCDFVFIATHIPLMGKSGMLSAGLFQSKLAPYSSYVIGARVAKGAMPHALYWDTSDPYYYLRVELGSRSDYVVFGGEDHKTGQDDDPKQRFKSLEAALKRYLKNAHVDRHWSGQVIETNDGLPFIGETSPNQFVATGFSGNGMTFGTLGAMMAVDKVQGKKNPWEELFDVRRKKLRGGTWNYVKENLDYPYYMLRDRVRRAEATSLRRVRQGEGRIVSIKGERLAAYRDEQGKVTTLSPVCTHLGCIVHWNEAERTWDCPCHGSRFQATGEVLAGPAETPLEKQQAK